MLLLMWACGALINLSIFAISEKHLTVGQSLLLIFFGLFAPVMLLFTIGALADYKIWKHPTYRD